MKKYNPITCMLEDTAKNTKDAASFPAEVYNLQNEVAKIKHMNKNQIVIRRLTNNEYEYSSKAFGDPLAVYNSKNGKLFVHDSKSTKDSKSNIDRRIVKSIAEEVIKNHGENNSVGKFDKFIRTMMDRWADSGHDRDFIKYVIEKAYEKEFSSKDKMTCDVNIDFDIDHLANYLWLWENGNEIVGKILGELQAKTKAKTREEFYAEVKQNQEYKKILDKLYSDLQKRVDKKMQTGYKTILKMFSNVLGR